MPNIGQNLHLFPLKLNRLFRCVSIPGAYRPKNGQNGHLAIRPCAINTGNWGIPEKNYENVAQQCKLDGCSMFLQDSMAKNRFLHILAFFTL